MYRNKGQKKNKNNKIRFWRKIRFKMMIGLCAIFISCGFFLYWIIIRQTVSSTETQIITDMKALKNNSEIYVKQLLILRQANNDEDSYRDNIDEIVNELYVSTGYELAAYDMEGENLVFTSQTAMAQKPDDATWKRLAAGEAVISIITNDFDQCQVYAALPMNIEGNIVGLISYYVDYSEQLTQGINTANVILGATLGVFIATFFMLLLMASTMLNPIQKLSIISSYISKRMKDNPLAVNDFHNLKLSRRKDEIGRLFRNYQEMLDIVSKQFYKINRDKEKIEKLLSNKQEFYNNVTHELKTPLTTINGYAQLIAENGMEDKDLIETGISHILHESTRLHQMVVQLLEMSNVEIETEHEPVDILEVLNSVVHSLEIKANRYGNHIEFTAHIKEKCFVLGVAAKLRQLFINLIDNSIKYGLENTSIPIKVDYDDKEIRIEVINFGEGISKDRLSQIFEPFYRVDKEYSREQGSAGLGLSICKKIVYEHGGRIGVTSVPDEITTFWVEFDRWQEEA